MKISMQRMIGWLALAGVLIPALAADGAQARGRSHSGSYVTGKGRSGTYSGSVSGNRTEGLTHRQSLTTESGKTYNRSSTGTYHRETGAFDRTVTGAGGTTRTYIGTAQDGQRGGAYSTSAGRSGSFDSHLERNDDGTVTKNSQWITQDGNSYNRSATTGYDNGTVSRSVTGPGGDTRSGTLTVTPDGR